MAIMILTDFLSGGLFPLSLLPAGFYNLVHILPFNYTIFFPVNMLTSNMSTNSILMGLLAQAMWILVLGMLAQAVLKKGRKRYEATGI